jgi:ABC-2 type transport system permease protein
MSAAESLGAPVAGGARDGRAAHGPSALGGDLSRFWALTLTLARTEFKMRFFGSALGYLWTLVRPLLFFGVLWLFFTKVAHVNRGNSPAEKDYGVQLLASIVLFTFFTEATTGSVRSVVDRENLVRKIHFPRMVIPLSIVLLAFFNLCLNLIVVAIFALGAGVEPTLSWLELPLIIGGLVIFAAGVSMLLSALFVHFRDIQPIWEVVTQILLYASPVIISINTIREKLSTTLVHVYMLNPLADTFQQFRHAFVTSATPGVGQLLGSWYALLEPVAIVAFVFVAGFLVFNRAAVRIAENL